MKVFRETGVDEDLGDYVRQWCEGLAKTPEAATLKILQAVAQFERPPAGHRRVGLGSKIQPDLRVPALLRWLVWSEDRPLPEVPS